MEYPPFNDAWYREDAELKRQFRANGRSLRPQSLIKRRPPALGTIKRPFLWGQLTANLTAGGSATARRLEWPTPDDTDYAIDTDEAAFTAYDDFWGTLAADSGDKIIYAWDHGRRVILMTVKRQSQAEPVLRGYLTTDLTQNGSATLDIWTGSPGSLATTSTTKTIYADFLITTGYKLAIDTWVVCRYDHTEDDGEDIYYVAEANPCEVLDE